MEPVHQPRLVEPQRDGFGAGHADNAAARPPLIAHALGESVNGSGHGPGQRQDRHAQIGKPVARWQPLDQPMTQPGLQLCQPALHGGLVDAQRAGGGKGAAGIGNGQQKTQIVPVEHPVHRISAAPFRKHGAVSGER